MGYSVSMAMKLIDGVSPSYRAMTSNVVKYSNAQHSALTRGNSDFSRMITTAKGFVLGRGITFGINRVRTALSGLVGEWIQFDNTAAFAASKWEEVTKGAMTYSDALLETKNIARSVGAVTKFTAAEVVEAQEWMAMGGFKLRESNKETMMSFAKFATVAKTTMPEGARMATNIMDAWGKSISDLPRLNDQMVATVNSAKIQLSDLAESTVKAGPLYRKAGQEISTFNAIVMGLAKSGVVAETAGIRARSMVLALIDPRSRKAFSALKIPVAKDGEIRPFIDILTDLQVKLRGFGTEKKLMVLRSIFQKRDVTAAALLMEKTGGDLGQFVKIVENSAGQMDTQFARVQGSMLNRLLILKSALTEKFFSGMETANNPLSLLVSDLINGVQEIDMTKINQFIGTNLPKTLDTLKSAFVALQGPLKTAASLTAFIFDKLLAMSPVLSPLISLYIKYKAIMFGVAIAQGALNIAMLINNSTIIVGLKLVALEIAKSGLLAGAKYALTLAQSALNAAMYANPIGLVILAIAALIGIVYVITKKWDDWGESITNFWDKFKFFIFLLFPYLALIIDFIITIRNNWQGLIDVFDNNGVGGVFKEIGKILIGSLLTPIEWILFGLNKMGAVSDAAFEKFKKFRNGLMTVGEAKVTIGGASGALNGFNAADMAASGPNGGYGNESFASDATAIAQPEFRAPNQQEVEFQKRYISQVDINLFDPGNAVESASSSGYGTSIRESDGTN